MNRGLVVAAALAVWALAGRATANTEPTAYDTRSIGMGLTGVAHLARPAAVAVNPANLTGIERGGASLSLSPLLYDQRAPVGGPPPTPSIEAPLAFGPLGSVFGAFRPGERFVLGAGVYFEQGYGSAFEGVTMLHGAPVSEQTGGRLDEADLSVLFVQAEAALAAGVTILPNLSVGVALRLPFVRQDADLLQRLPLPGQDDYVRVRNSFSGVSWPWDPFPAVKLGITYEPSDRLALAVVYRSKAEIPMSGTASVHSPELAQLADPESDAAVLRLPASSTWVTPHVLHFGVNARTRDLRWSFPIEYRLQLHRSANDVQAISARVPIGGVETAVSLDANLFWTNVHSVRFGMERRLPSEIAIRAGGNAATSATSTRGAQFFTPPPGFNGALFLGAGKRFGDFVLDFAAGIAGGRARVAHHPEACAETASVKTGCGGAYAIATYWMSAQFLWQPGRD